jgi:ATP-dependent DNA ligase
MAEWSTRSAHARRAPVGFIVPCQPTLSQVVPTGPEWIHEIKWDGYHIVARRHGNLIRLWPRNGRSWTETFPAITSALRALPTDGVIIDGEAVCLRDDGSPDFNTIRSQRTCKTARLMAFDLLFIVSCW